MNCPAEMLSPKHTPLVVKLAERTDEIEQALRLRFRVFMEEARNLSLYNENSIEQDDFDQHCDHLLVKDPVSGQVVGTYRLLPGERTVGIGFYSETEFDLSGFQSNRYQTLELGRSCIAPEYRGSTALKMLWEGIANYLSDHPHKYLIGCASLHVKSLQELNRIYSMLKRRGIIRNRFDVRPLATHLIEGLRVTEAESDEKGTFRRLPPLMKGYHRLGAEIEGEPAYDSMFDTTDFFVVLMTDCVTKRYRRHFLDQ